MNDDIYIILVCIGAALVVLFGGYNLGVSDVSKLCDKNGYFQEGQKRYICKELK